MCVYTYIYICIHTMLDFMKTISSKDIIYFDFLPSHHPYLLYIPPYLLLSVSFPPLIFILSVSLLLSFSLCV